MTVQRTVGGGDRLPATRSPYLSYPGISRIRALSWRGLKGFVM